MLWTSQRLGKHVRSLLGRLDAGNIDISHLDAFADDMMTDIDVFRAGMRGRIACKSNCRLVIDVQSCRTILNQSQLAQEVPEPDGRHLIMKLGYSSVAGKLRFVCLTREGRKSIAVHPDAKKERVKPIKITRHLIPPIQALSLRSLVLVLYSSV